MKWMSQYGKKCGPIIYECARFRGKTFIHSGVSDEHVQTAKKLVALLSAARKGRGMSQESLAVSAGVSPSCVQHLEHSRSTPTLVTLLRLAEALDLDLPELLRSAQGNQEPPGKTKK